MSDEPIKNYMATVYGIEHMPKAENLVKASIPMYKALNAFMSRYLKDSDPTVSVDEMTEFAKALAIAEGDL